MNLPFALSDLLERVIPGSIFMFFISIAAKGVGSLSLIEGWSTPALIAAAALAYAVGVMLNALASLSNLGDNRIYFADPPTAIKSEVSKAIESYFGVTPDEQSWKFCLGICAKHGYSANTQLFQGLFVFCRSMCVCCLLGSAMILAMQAYSQIGFDPVDLSSLIVAVCGLLSSWIFYTGVRIYTRSFVGSIYEGFYTWHRETHFAKKVD
jgi:hypothetical protein